MISLAVILLLGFETLVGTKMTPKEYYPLAENRLHDGIFDGAELILRQEILEERRYPAIPKQRSLRSEKMESGPEGRIKSPTTDCSIGPPLRQLFLCCWSRQTQVFYACSKPG